MKNRFKIATDILYEEKPVKVHKRLNPMHPAPDVTTEELEAEWGNPDKIREISKAELERIRHKVLDKKRKPY